MSLFGQFRDPQARHLLYGRLRLPLQMRRPPLVLQSSKGTRLQRASSFILLSSQASPPLSSTARLTHVMSPKKKVAAQHVSNVVVESVLELVINVFTDQVLARKEFPGFGLFLKVPPGFQEHQAYFEVLCQPKVLTNMGRLNLHMVEATFEGWFLNGAAPMLDFTGNLLEFLQRPEISSAKDVRLCHQAVATIRVSFLKLVLLRLSDMDDAMSDSDALSVLDKIFYWQTVLLECLSADDDYMKLIWYQLYAKLLDTREPIRLAAASIWRVLLVQKPEESAIVFRQCATSEQLQLTKGFRRLTEVDDGAFVEWVDQHRPIP